MTAEQQAFTAGLMLGAALAAAETQQDLKAMDARLQPLEAKLRLFARIVGSLRPIIHRGRRIYTLGAIE
jgi:hypothetical protein